MTKKILISITITLSIAISVALFSIIQSHLTTDALLEENAKAIAHDVCPICGEKPCICGDYTGAIMNNCYVGGPNCSFYWEGQIWDNTL